MSRRLHRRRGSTVNTTIFGLAVLLSLVTLVILRDLGQVALGPDTALAQAATSEEIGAAGLRLVAVGLLNGRIEPGSLAVLPLAEGHLSYQAERSSERKYRVAVTGWYPLATGWSASRQDAVVTLRAKEDKKGSAFVISRLQRHPTEQRETAPAGVPEPERVVAPVMVGGVDAGLLQMLLVVLTVLGAVGAMRSLPGAVETKARPVRVASHEFVAEAPRRVTTGTWSAARITGSANATVASGPKVAPAAPAAVAQAAAGGAISDGLATAPSVWTQKLSVALLKERLEGPDEAKSDQASYARQRLRALIDGPQS